MKIGKIYESEIIGRKKKKYMIAAITIFFLTIIVYNIYDNNRFNIVEQTVKLDKLPKAFDNFKILQITDLHEKRFGKDQKTLVDAINKLDYDIIVVTGDIVNGDTQDIKPFQELMMGIKKKDLVFFVGGNNDPHVSYEGKVTLFGQSLQNLGCILLNKPYAIKRGGDILWVMRYLYNERNEDNVFKVMAKNDIRVALNHYPIYELDDDDFYVSESKKYDLIFAGHYHGGQVRIPFLGALYVPMGGINGLFPNQNKVSGLEEEGNFRQYVSRGLGASGPKFLAFRVFNTPEINIIRLKQ